MPKRRDFTKTEILNAMDKTKSVKVAARYLNCSYQHLKPWMKFYKDEETGLTLFDLHKNQTRYPCSPHPQLITSAYSCFVYKSFSNPADKIGKRNQLFGSKL